MKSVRIEKPNARIEQPLHLKYRPRVFDDITGQSSVVSRLKGILKSQKIPTAMFFAGASGCGKTTLSRMFATYLNCATLSACGTCRSCQRMASGDHPDYKEINAANTRGIDDVRALIGEARFKPQVGNFRIIVGDEFQGLTTPAANSLLKPIEEPPPNTIWILSSMEPQKVSPAIINRCTQFQLKLLDRNAIVSRLRHICEAEGVNGAIVSEDILSTIADLSGGHVRQALQILESVLQYIGGAGKSDNIEDGIRTSVLDGALVDSDDNVALRILMSLYMSNSKVLHKTLYGTADYFGLVLKLLNVHEYALAQILFDADHTSIWHTTTNKALWSALTEKIRDIKSNQVYREISICIQKSLVELRQEMGNFIIPERILIGTRLQEACLEIKRLKVSKVQ